MKLGLGSTAVRSSVTTAFVKYYSPNSGDFAAPLRRCLAFCILGCQQRKFYVPGDRLLKSFAAPQNHSFHSLGGEMLAQWPLYQSTSKAPLSSHPKSALAISRRGVITECPDLLLFLKFLRSSRSLSSLFLRYSRVASMFSTMNGLLSPAAFSSTPKFFHRSQSFDSEGYDPIW